MAVLAAGSAPAEAAGCGDGEWRAYIAFESGQRTKRYSGCAATEPACWGWIGRKTGSVQGRFLTAYCRNDDRMVYANEWIRRRYRQTHPN
ncbi:hypothetical protein [Acuticoccus sediminis]|uniref:hypothetical protein n=1 Tax=Acuticoccus sediminis TaxID=2184697 RepID=UPI001CFDB509|nr:hypothetical protein [Acuticoccus sediminis]